MRLVVVGFLLLGCRGDDPRATGTARRAAGRAPDDARASEEPAQAGDGAAVDGDRPRARDIGLSPGVLPTGRWNAITDVSGVRVGHVTIREGDSVRTGVTVVLPHGGNVFQEKVPAAIHVGNAFGKLVGATQVEELGSIETPIVLTNTLSVWDAANAVVGYVLSQPGNEEVRSVNPVVGETNDGYLNDIRGRHVKEEHVLGAIRDATEGPVEIGSVGAGTGTVCFGFKGGIGTSSRALPESLGGHVLGVLVQTNFGGVLQMDGLPMGEEMGRHYLRDEIRGERGETADGSVIVVVATDAPLRHDELGRLASRAMLGVARTGSSASHGSGDYVIAFSTSAALRSPHRSASTTEGGPVLRGERLSPLFQAAIEATEEAIYDSLLGATTTRGRDGHVVEAIPIDRIVEIARRHGRHVPTGGDAGGSG